MATKTRRKAKVASTALAPTKAKEAEPEVLQNAAQAGPISPALPAAALAVPTISGLYPELPPGRGEMRLDVDGDNPQMTISGLIIGGVSSSVHWIAKLSATPVPNQWAGSIWFRNGTAALLPHTSVVVTVTASGGARDATVLFRGGGVPQATRKYRRRSAFFHPVEFEFDVVQGTTAVTKIDTCAHPNRPAALACETLDIETAFRRAGFEVSVSPKSGSVPLTVAGANRTWSNTEMHDAMQTFWSRFANRAHWSMWVLFAARHDQGPSLGGIMFDDIGPNHRQGTAIFNDSFIANPPAGDPAPAAWIRRMRFWTACHEMGHAFNLAHAWQKALGTPWIPLSDEPESRSFMNYPFNVNGGQTAFFSDFFYRFSDQELLFMRHAPERFVQMGNAAWFDHHGFENTDTSPEPKFKVELRVNRPSAVFDFLEPCVIEVKLTNISENPQIVSEHVLEDSDRMMVIIKRNNDPARQWLPFAQYCRKSPRVVVEPGASRYDSLFIGAGRNGWDLAEPGRYQVHMVLRISGEDYISNTLDIRVTPARGYDDEYLAQDMFSKDVGRVLAFDGSRVLDSANNVLREVADKLPDRPVAKHALVALSRPMLRDGKVLYLPQKQDAEMESAALAGGAVTVKKAQPRAAQTGMGTALLKDAEASAETLGNIDYKRYVDRLSDQLATDGDTKAAVAAQDRLLGTLQSRKVVDRVLDQVKERRRVYTETNRRARR